MSVAALEGQLRFVRKKTMELLDKIAAEADPAAILGYRPGPGRAHIAWQFMHLGATDDRHLEFRMHGRDPVAPQLVQRFAGGSTPDDQIPTVDEIRAYLTERRDAMLAHLRTLTEADLARKPNEQAPWIYEEWFQLLAWHEAHHQGQAHLTLNLFKAAHPTA
ncbi:MAG: DinB family protein [Isosphaeraceae bacterium]|nr:DinB family protein [Isosphaeraceae bacterium]